MSGRDGLARRKSRIRSQAMIINLHLEEYFEDISSTSIRENIDSNRDISNLIDPVAQNYIFENGLYMREPAYKHVLQARDIHLSEFCSGDPAVLEDLRPLLSQQGYDMDELCSYLSQDNVRMIFIKDGRSNDKVVAVAAVNRLDSIHLLSAFRDQDIAAYIRSMAAGAIAVIGGAFFTENSSITNLGQIIRWNSFPSCLPMTLPMWYTTHVTRPGSMRAPYMW